MFSVLFEVHPRSEQYQAYLSYARMLRPELEQIEGFIDNVRYRSLTRAGWILSLSGWQDEKALVRWRTCASHHEMQGKARTEVMLDYHLRVGQIAEDTRPAEDTGPAENTGPAERNRLREQRWDETEVGEATTITLLDASHASEWVEASRAERVAGRLGLDLDLPGLVGWDVFDAVLRPGDVMLMLAWRNAEAAERFEKNQAIPIDTRLRRIRIIRDYGMFDRREGPQYFAPVERS